MDNSIFISNLKNLMTNNNLTQRNLSDATHVSPATINMYLNKNLEPSLNFLCEIKKNYGYSIDDFCFKNINFMAPEEKIKLNQSLRKFIGTYILYCYNSSEYKGKVSSFSKSTLKYGVLTILANESGNGLRVVCNFIKERDFAETFKQTLDETPLSEREALHTQNEQCYTGNIETSLTQIFIYLKSDLLNDQSLIILNNPPSNKEYIGGLGTANSVSRGREHMPCIQFILLSKKVLKIPDGEIYNMLSLGVSDVNVEVESEQLLNLFKNLYIKNDNIKDDLSEYQKKKIFENSLNNILIDLIDANMFRFAKVSNTEDDDYYRIIKDE